jgi:predicted DNA-binding transcriptional regulator YafY
MRGQQVRIRVRFSRQVAPWVGERLWHPSQALRWLGDRRLEMTLRVADTPEIRRWLAGFGPDAEVLEPAGLREALRLQAQAAARAAVGGRRPGTAVGVPRAEAPQWALPRGRGAERPGVGG